MRTAMLESGKLVRTRTRTRTARYRNMRVPWAAVCEK